MTLGGVAVGLRVLGLAMFAAGVALHVGDAMVAGLAAMWVAEMVCA